MKIKLLISIFSASLITIMMSAGCKTSSKKDYKQFFETNKEEGFGKVLSDSISNIIIDANKISCKLIKENCEDSISKQNFMEVPSKFCPTVKFLFLNEQNFQSNDLVFGQFAPWVEYVFYAKKKGRVKLELDFGLRKWRLLNQENEQIFGGDMKEMNMQFLYLTRLLFPNDEILNLLNEKIKYLKNEKNNIGS